MRRLLVFAVVLVLALAGCSTRSGSDSDGPSGREQPIAGPDDAASAGPTRDREEGLSLSQCRGAMVALYYDTETAERTIPAPFEPLATGPAGALGSLSHRQCQASVNGIDHGAVALAVALGQVSAPDNMTQGNRPYYILGVHTDSAAVADVLSAQGVPVEVTPMADNSVWTVGWIGVIDTAMGGDRIVGEVADSDIVTSGGLASEMFYRSNDTIVRWDHNLTSAGGEISETVVMLDEGTWGTPAAPNVYFSTYETAASLYDHRFAWFTPHGEPIEHPPEQPGGDPV